MNSCPFLGPRILQPWYLSPNIFLGQESAPPLWLRVHYDTVAFVLNDIGLGTAFELHIPPTHHQAASRLCSPLYHLEITQDGSHQ